MTGRAVLCERRAMSPLRVCLSLVLAASLVGGCKRSGAGAAAPPALTAAERERALDEAARLGQAIYVDDAFSAKATDVVLENVATAALTHRGWLTTRVPGGVRVDFYAPRGRGHDVVYRVTFSDAEPGGVFTRQDPPEPLDPAREAMIRALALAQTVPFPACRDRNYNFVILPASAVGRRGWYVYLLAAHQTREEVVLGGHVRVHVAEDGRKVLGSFALSKGCMVEDSRRLPEGATRASIMVSIRVAQVPLETHVYLSLLHRMPVGVLTPDGTVWTVEGAKIRRVER